MYIIFYLVINRFKYNILILIILCFHIKDYFYKKKYTIKFKCQGYLKVILCMLYKI